MSSISRWYLDAQHSFSFKRYTKFRALHYNIECVTVVANLRQLRISTTLIKKVYTKYDSFLKTSFNYSRISFFQLVGTGLCKVTKKLAYKRKLTRLIA